MSNASDLEGAGGLGVLHLQVDGGPHTFGQVDALQQRRVQVEGLRHGAPGFTERAKQNSHISMEIKKVTSD